MKNSITRALVALTLLGSASLSAQARLPAPPTMPATTAQARERLDELVVAFGGRLEGSDNTDLSRDLRLLLTHTPALVPEVPLMLRDASTTNESRGYMILALKQVGTPAAQQALSTIHRDRGQAHMDRLRAVMSAAAVEQPTEQAVDGLWAAAAGRFDGREVDISNTAYLSLGIVGSTLRAQEQASRYEDIRDGLLSALRTTPDSTERVVLLKAVGNLGDAELGAELTESLFDEQAPVRVAAAQAVGLVRDGTALEALRYVLKGETRGAVRAEIARSLRKLPVEQDTLELLHGMLLHELHVEARAQMASYLVEHLDVYEDARPALLHLVHNDPTKRVRLIAARAM